MTFIPVVQLFLFVEVFFRVATHRTNTLYFASYSKL